MCFYFTNESLGVFDLRISFVGKAPCRKFKFELEFIKSV